MDIYDAHSYMQYAMDSEIPKNLSTVSSYESMANREISKPRDFRITELEEKLVTAEVRCSELRKQVAYMRLLYTSSHHIPFANESDNEKKNGEKASNMIEEELYNAESTSAVSFVEADYPPANMSTNLQNKAALPNDPKDAMEWIVNEMTQSLNAMDSASTLHIHSNTIEKVAPPSKGKRSGVVKRKMPQPEQLKQHPPNKKNAKTQLRSKIKEEKSLTSRLSSFKISKRKTANSNRQQVKVERKKPQPKSKIGLKNWARAQTTPKKIRLDEIDNRTDWRAKTADYLRQEPINTANSIVPLPNRTNSTYLMPTLSYRMKCVPKNYTERMTFRRIPFVVGKSTTKTHNLGSKIQETLSLIKLSRKGIPTSSSKTELNELLTDAPAGDPRSTSVGYNNSSGKNGDFAAPDCKNGQLRTVLLNLHDEFSRMNDEYEEMKASLKNEQNPELVKQLKITEQVLNAKEAEIDVFMSLFNEVSELKEKLVSGTSTYLAMGRPATANNTNETTPTLKLIRLLRRIETFQTQLKNTSYV